MREIREERADMAKFIVIDGLDGCGKATQTALLKNELESRGYNVVSISFPDYDSESSTLVKMYLNGELGSDSKVINPYISGSFYTMDRAIQYITKLKKDFAKDNNTIILADRYTSANVIHQAAKIDDRTDRHRYIDWMLDFEYIRCRLPIEDITIVLSIEPKTSQVLLNKRYNGDTTKKDIHEADLNYLEMCHKYLLDSIRYVNECNNGSYYHKNKTWVKLDCDLVDFNEEDELHEDPIFLGVDSVESIHANIMWYVDRILNKKDIPNEYRRHYTQDGVPKD